MATRPPRWALKHLGWYAPRRPVYSGGNEVALLKGGAQLFPAMCAAIERARHEVWLATYIFNDDAAAACIVLALIHAAQRGARVRLVVDGWGSVHCLNRPMLRRLADHGVNVAVFRPLETWWSWLRPGQLRRLHMKLCVVDGEVGFVGGINLMHDHYDLGHGWTEQPRLDYAVQVRGPAVGPIEQTAQAMWSRAWFGHDWRGELADLVRRMWRGPKRLARARRLVRRLRMRQNSRDARHFAMATQDPSPMRAALVVRDNLRQRRTIERAYVDAISAARQRIDIACPYFYPGTAFRQALQAAARRGVQVRLLLQGKLDYRIAGMAARALYGELLAHGVRIWEYTPAFLHAKVAVVDGDWATVGSSNIDPVSLLVNLEANLVVRDAAFVQALSRSLEEDFAAAVEVTEATLSRILVGLGRGLVAWLAHLYLRLAGFSGRY